MGKGDFSTNPIEGFWSQLKRTIKGTHIKVSKKYLQRYVDECCFRNEYRKKPREMFDVLFLASFLRLRIFKVTIFHKI